MFQALNTQQQASQPFLPNWPLVVWMIFAALFLGLSRGLDAPELVRVFNAGWGRALGEFALVLLPSFVLA